LQHQNLGQICIQAATRIENAAQRGEKVIAEMDGEGNHLEELDFADDGAEEVIYAGSLCQLKNMLEMLELLLAFHAWYQRCHAFYCRLTRNLRCKKQSEL